MFSIRMGMVAICVFLACTAWMRATRTARLAKKQGQFGRIDHLNLSRGQWVIVNGWKYFKSSFHIAPPKGW